MRDRDVQHPNRYKDRLTGQIIDLESMPGEVIDAGSLYCKANVLPNSVCLKLGLIPEIAEPADAFEAVYPGRYYGRISQLDGNYMVGGVVIDGGRVISEYYRSTSYSHDDYDSLELESGTDYYTKLFVPAGAKRVRITAVIYGARLDFGTSSVDLHKNSVSVMNIGSFNTTSNVTVTKVIDINVTGDGQEHFQIMLNGENNNDNVDSLGQAGCKLFGLEVMA